MTSIVSISMTTIDNNDDLLSFQFGSALPLNDHDDSVNLFGTSNANNDESASIRLMHLVLDYVIQTVNQI